MNGKLIVLAAWAVSSLTAVHAQDPIIQTKYTADPAPLVHNDTVFLYAGHDDGDFTSKDRKWGFLMRDWLLYTSTDMVNWTDHGPVADLYNFKWADPNVSGKEGFKNGAWAPQCVERNGKFYFYGTIEGRGIGVLVADSPYGPFVDPIGKPLIGPEYDSIDPTILIDDDGQAYIYWGNPNLWYAKLNEDMVSLAGPITKDANIRKVKGRPDPYHYQEGPWVHKRNGHYYCSYATTCCPEGMGYSMAKSPVGPWEFKGYIMKPDKRSDGNHPGIIDYKGKTYVFGFNYKLNYALTDKKRERRSICVAEMKYNSDGTIQELPWWYEGTPVKAAENLNPYRRVEAETIAWSEGLETERNYKVGVYVTSVHDGDYIQVKSVDFKKGARRFEMNALPLCGGEIEIRLDGREGKLLGTCKIDSSSQDEWKTFTTTVEKVKGVHDLYFIFRGGEGKLFNLNYWTFRK